MRYALVAVAAIALALAGYGVGYVQASRRWDHLNAATTRLVELDRSWHLLQLAERVDAGDVSGARLRMLAVSAVSIHAEAFGIPKHEPLSTLQMLQSSLYDGDVRAFVASVDAQNERRERELRGTLQKLCSVAAAAGSEYNGACRR